MGYAEFDNTPSRRDYTPHVQDWKIGDPVWKGNKGKGLIGAVNYLASKKANSMYFLTYNSDALKVKSVFPWIAHNIRDRYDCSKLDQWEIVFAHMQRKGILMHVVLQERENDQMRDHMWDLTRYALAFSASIFLISK